MEEQLAPADGNTENEQPATPPPVEEKPEKKPFKLKFDKRVALRWTLMTFGTVLMSLSVYFFQVPNNFTIGGIAALAIVLTQFIPISQAALMAIFNGALLILGLIILGKSCTVRTVYCTVLYTGLIWLLEFVLPLEKPLTATWLTDPVTCEILLDAVTGERLYESQRLLELVYAILLVGFGGALIFNCGGSSGGTDIIALILKKFTNINVGMAVLLIDFTIVCVSIFAFESVEIALLSFLGLFAKSFLLDGVIESIGKTKHITIITSHHEEIGQFILNVVKHGYTVYDAEGGYTHEQKKVLVTVCKRSEALKLKMKVKDYDKDAFVIITDANEILGKGFGGTI